MNFKHLLATLLGAAAFAAVSADSAQAAVLTSTNAAPGTVATDFSSAGLVAFNLDLAQLRNTTLTFTLEAADLAGPTLAFNALVSNLSGAGFSRFGFHVDGISFSGAQGSVTPLFTGVASVTAGAQAVDVAFTGPEYAELHFGNPLAENGKLDWSFSTAGLQAGDTFSVTSAVPEPGNVALVLAGLGVIAAVRRRGTRA
jgi:hypothetical protein